MACLKTKRTVLLAEQEATYGTDPTPVNTANAIEAYDVTYTINADMKERNPGNSDLSMFPEARGKTSVEIKFSTKVRGQGTAGMEARLGPLLQACGMSSTIVSSTSVTNAPLSATFLSAAIWVYIDGVICKATGCVGDLEMDLTSGEFGMFNFTFKGIYEIPIDGAIVDPTFDTPDPEIVKACTFTFGGYAAIIEKLSFRLNNVIAERPDFNQTEGIKGYCITGRNPEGSMTVEALIRAECNADFYSYFHNRTVKALSFVLGGTAGNILTWTSSYCYLRAPVWGDREGSRTFELPFQMARSTGNDEFSLAWT